MNFPNIADHDLVFDERETKQILSFFFPNMGSQITTMTVTNDVRRFAQSILIVAIDASASMSYVEAVVTSLKFLPGRSIKSWAKKLTKGLVKRWFKNATQEDLLNAEVYESVRRTVAWNCMSVFQDIINTGAMARNRMPARQFVRIESSTKRWA
jgi:hypothetical protein